MSESTIEVSPVPDCAGTVDAETQMLASVDEHGVAVTQPGSADEIMAGEGKPLTGTVDDSAGRLTTFDPRNVGHEKVL